MPAITVTNKAYQESEQAVRMTGAAKDTILENALSRYKAESKNMWAKSLHLMIRVPAGKRLLQIFQGYGGTVSAATA